MRFWVSWLDCEEDFRPLEDPPSSNILGWWCTGETADDESVIVAMVEAEGECDAKRVLERMWPETRDLEFRFFDEVPDSFRPTDRFPLKHWMRERIEDATASP